MEQVYNQCPPHITYEFAEEIFNKNDKDVLKTLSELWDIKEPEKAKPTKWDEIRETCDAFDTEMVVFMKNMKNKKIEEEVEETEENDTEANDGRAD